MNKHPYKNRKLAAELLTAVVLFLLLVSAAVTVTLHFRPLYYMDIHTLHIEAQSGLSEKEIRLNYDALIDYNSIFGGVKELVFPTLSMSETGRIHFEEVKVIFAFFQWMSLLCLALAGILLYFNQRRGYYRFWKYAGILSAAVPIALGVLIAQNWDRVFILFHKIAFNNDYWIFDASTDPVITILPDGFFLHCAVMITGIVFLGSFGFYMVYHRTKKQKKQKGRKESL